MRLLARLRNVLTAKVHAVTDRLEDPECMAAQALREAEEELDDLRQQAAMVIAVERRLGRDLQQQEAQANHWKEQARLALAHGREDLARWALARQLQQQDRLYDLQTQHEAARQASDEVKKAVQALGDKLDEAQHRHRLLTARQRSARIRVAAQKAIGSGRESAGILSTRFAHWEDRLEESADVLLALVEVNEPRQNEEIELAALEANERLERELAALKTESNPQP